MQKLEKGSILTYVRGGVASRWFVFKVWPARLKGLRMNLLCGSQCSKTEPKRFWTKSFASI